MITTMTTVYLLYYLGHQYIYLNLTNLGHLQPCKLSRGHLSVQLAGTLLFCPWGGSLNIALESCSVSTATICIGKLMFMLLRESVWLLKLHIILEDVVEQISGAWN